MIAKSKTFPGTEILSASRFSVSFWFWLLMRVEVALILRHSSRFQREEAAAFFLWHVVADLPGAVWAMVLDVPPIHSGAFRDSDVADPSDVVGPVVAATAAANGFRSSSVLDGRFSAESAPRARNYFGGSAQIHTDSGLVGHHVNLFVAVGMRTLRFPLVFFVDVSSWVSCAVRFFGVCVFAHGSVHLDAETCRAFFYSLSKLLKKESV